MDDLISRVAAIELIESRQRELCPAGMFGRHAVYGTDREKFDHLQEIIDEIECLPAVDAVPVQEPRVMTLEEIRMANGGDVWLELSGNIAEDVIFAATIDGCGTKGVSTRYEALDYKMYGVKPYGWRCWTSRPSDEVRRATPWSEQDQREYQAAVEMAEYCEHYEQTYNAGDGSM